jgi:ATP-dependent Zn protease
VSAGLEQARAVLQQHRALLERGAQELLQKESLDEDAIRGHRRPLRGVDRA